MLAAKFLSRIGYKEKREDMLFLEKVGFAEIWRNYKLTERKHG